MRLVIRPDAEIDITEGYEWYEHKQLQFLLQSLQFFLIHITFRAYSGSCVEQSSTDSPMEFSLLQGLTLLWSWRPCITPEIRAD